MAILRTGAQDYGDILISHNGLHVRLAIHILNASVAAKLSTDQVRDLITTLRQVVAEIESNEKTQ